MTLFVPEQIPRYQEGVLRYLDTNFERLRQAFLQLKKSTAGASFPGSATAGDQFFNTSTGTLYVYDGADWVPSGGKLPRSHQLLAGGQTLANGANTNINWGAAQVASGVTTATNTVTPTVKGWWNLDCSVSVGAHATGMRAIYATRDGVAVKVQTFAVVNATFNWPLNINFNFYSAGTGSVDVFRIFVYQNSGVGLGMVTAESRLSLHYLGGGNP